MGPEYAPVRKKFHGSRHRNAEIDRNKPTAASEGRGIPRLLLQQFDHGPGRNLKADRDKIFDGLIPAQPGSTDNIVALKAKLEAFRNALESLDERTIQ